MVTEPLKTIIIDNKKPSREALAAYIRNYCTGVDIVNECDSLKTAPKVIKRK